MTLIEMREKQAKLLADARAKLDEITSGTAETRAAEIEREYDAIMAKYDALEARCVREEGLATRQATLDAGDTRRPGGEQRQVPGLGHNNGPALEERGVFNRVMAVGMANLTPEERAFAQTYNAALTGEVRAQAIATGAAGGFSIPQGFLPEIIQAQAMWGPMLDPTVTRVLDTDTGNTLPWPTVNDIANVGVLLTENTASGEQDVTFGQGSLSAFVYTSRIVRVSLQLMQDSAFDMGGVLDELFGERIGRAANIGLTTGTGGGTQPNGIVNGAAAGITAASATVFTSDELIDLYHSVDPAYRSSPKFRWMMNDDTLKRIRKLKDGQGNYLWQMGDVKAGTPALLLTAPIVINQAMASVATGTRPIIVGDFNKYIVRRVKDYTLLRLAERYADFLQVGFIAFNRVDGLLADSTAVKRLTML